MQSVEVAKRCINVALRRVIDLSSVHAQYCASVYVLFTLYATEPVNL
jgi:hypothetical protein